MTGLDKIIEKIEADGRAECEAIISSAKDKAKELDASAGPSREKKVNDIIEKAKAHADEIRQRGESAAQQIERQTLLRYRIEAVNESLDRALSELKRMRKDEYFKVLSSLAVFNARKGRGVLYLSEKDRSAMPSDFIGKINLSLSDGYSIEAGDKSVDIDGGFILSYGDIDINCSFDALAADKRDELKEKICSIIF
ncbi:MAG: V-type ATP synthase subunit E [Clostridiales bacterium]|nr:V-type ATP synthase subunit E [Clostridiales bacterium]